MSNSIHNVTRAFTLNSPWLASAILHIAGVAVGALISLTLTLLGLLMLSGAIAFARQIIVEPSPPPPPPPPPPPRPSRPPLAASQVLLERPACQVEVAGAFVSRVGNKICEDGGEGSESSDCPFG